MDKKMRKDILKICVFIVIANLPFVTIICQVGIDTFLDTFENSENYYYISPGHYNYLEFSPILEDSDVNKEDHILLQKQSHPEFSLDEEDIIIYYSDEGGLYCNKIYHANLNSPIKSYYTVDYSNHNNQPIYEYNIIGKIVGSLNDNIWNSLSIKTWETSINNFNIRALFTND